MSVLELPLLVFTAASACNVLDLPHHLDVILDALELLLEVVLLLPDTLDFKPVAKDGVHVRIANEARVVVHAGQGPLPCHVSVKLQTS